MSPVKFVSPPMSVKLTKAFTTPMQNVVATARTCYSDKLIVDEQIKNPEAMERIASSIYEAGHHTTYQHPHFQFAIEGVSRQCVWEFLHSHPFYNSEQQSQRYVHVSKDSVVVPELPVHEAMVYQTAMQEAFKSYEDISRLLRKAVTWYFHKRFPASERNNKKHEDAIGKKCQEIARYVLPIGTKTTLYHTISGLVAMRYIRACTSGDTTSEQRILASAMREAIMAHDPNYAMVMEDEADAKIFPEQNAEIPTDNDMKIAAKLFDRRMKNEGVEFSMLRSYTNSPDVVLAEAVRAVIGQQIVDLNPGSIESAISRVMDPACNGTLGESLNLSTMNKLTRALHAVSFTFQKRLSHTADSQDQRHRMTPAARPFLGYTVHDTPDFVTPAMLDINMHPAAADMGPEGLKDWLEAIAIFEVCMDRLWRAYEIIRKVNPEAALYVLPNALTIRFTESGDLSALVHKYKMRLCYNAQEEIWRASKEEVMAITQVAPIIGKYLLPPCTLRKMAGAKPICPEGPRYCGVRVWTMDIEDYERII